MVIDQILFEREASAAADSHEIGSSHPLGATIVPGGVNFSLFSRTASGVELLLFDRENDGRPARVIRFDPADNRTYYYWHLFVPGVQACGQIYGFRVDQAENSTPPAVSASIRPSSSWTRMDVPWWFPRTTTALRPARRVAIQPPR